MVAPYVECMVIDECKSKALTRYKKGHAVTSDHNTLTCSFNIPIQKKIEQRVEILTMRNKEDLDLYRKRTTETTQFTECFNQDGDVQDQGKKWLKLLLKVIHKTFKLSLIHI